jgi:hypothetical protein
MPVPPVGVVVVLSIGAGFVWAGTVEGFDDGFIVDELGGIGAAGARLCPAS